MSIEAGRMRMTSLTGVGLSERKAQYLRHLALHFLKGSIEPDRWPLLDDEAVIAELLAVRGIGRWTAEMFLMFNLMRPDVLPVDDLGLLTAIGLHYSDGVRVTRAFGASHRPWTI